MLDIEIKKSLPGFKLEVSFAVEREILAILGPSGCGKTMTLKCIAGLIQADEGRIALDDRLLFDSGSGVNIKSRERNMGFVFQNYALFPHMDVFNNIAFGIRQLPVEDIKEKVRLWLQKRRLSGLEKRFPGQLSAGQQQRVALARALVSEPEVLLLDEPFSALDSIVKERLEEELLEIHEFFPGHILFVTHNLAEAYKLSSKIAVYEAGRLLQFGEKEKVVNRPSNRVAARLTGVKNFLPAVVQEVESSSLNLELSGLGTRLKAGKVPGEKWESGQVVNLGIRPEYIRINDNGENLIAVLVEEVIEEISSYIIRCSLAGSGGEKILEARIPRTEAVNLSQGDSCQFCLPADKIFIMLE
ncbi:MAG TPA: molybdenum ABC transporter ATP-binding protein [Syntrophomonas wolfei]|uniref:Molybdenum ABC transporter ATP-binding protein n=1 Tax=Syntrophomonas wolfei TaxID=863 RepID=A0A354YY73_9FIRM|nr:molybdenum ABC transporter ATP-binding protein [Syntrophomonas wolfei]